MALLPVALVAKVKVWLWRKDKTLHVEPVCKHSDGLRECGHLDDVAGMIDFWRPQRGDQQRLLAAKLVSGKRNARIKKRKKAIKIELLPRLQFEPASRDHWRSARDGRVASAYQSSCWVLTGADDCLRSPEDDNCIPNLIPNILPLYCPFHHHLLSPRSLVMDAALEKQQGQPPPDAAKPETRLAGHIGHLTTQEQSALTAFKALCQKEGLYKPASDGSKASHDDGTLMHAHSTPLRSFVLADSVVVDI